MQVGASFVDELARLLEDGQTVARFPWLKNELAISVSSEVLQNCAQPTSRLIPKLTVHDATFDLSVLLDRYEVSFTIFGPEYVPTRTRRRIVGFADVTSLHPELLPSASGHHKARQIARRLASRNAFRFAHRIVVEAPQVARDLELRWKIPQKRIDVIPNSYNAVFDRPSTWEQITVPHAEGIGNVCYVTRGYSHKNIGILGDVGDRLSLLKVPARFVLTLTQAEWNDLPGNTRRHSINLGPVQVRQLPQLYGACQASIFPSLFEAFSATPLEALVTGTPLVASDRDFVRDSCKEVPWYADPEDADALARGLAAALNDSSEVKERVARGKALAKERPGADARALLYVKLIDSMLNS